jgi:hypothetical protein
MNVLNMTDRETPQGKPAGGHPRQTIQSILEAAMTKLFAPAGLVALVMVAAGCTRSTDPSPSASSSVRAASSTVAPARSSPDSAVAGWPAFASLQGGYRLRYPPGWRIKESVGTGGPVLSLLPPRGAGISVLATSTTPPEAGAANLQNTRCQPIRVGGLGGSRCLDTISMSVSTTLQGRERWYVLTTSLRRPSAPAGAYERVLASFRPT